MAMLCGTMRLMTDAVHEWPLGERVREARGTESERSVAKRAEISPEMYWQIENGRRRNGDPLKRPNAEIIAKVARAVDIPVAEALALAGLKPEHHMSAPPAEEELARKVGKLGPEEKRAIEIIVDRLLVARGYVSASSAGAVDVVVRSAGEEVHTDVQSHGEPMNGSAASKQRQED